MVLFLMAMLSILVIIVIIIYTFPSTVALESYRQKVAAKHQETIRQHEQRLRQIQRERQAVFDDAFKSDLAEFKQKGTIPSESQHFLVYYLVCKYIIKSAKSIKNKMKH